MTLSNLSTHYPASEIRRMFTKASQFQDVIYLTMGEPNFPSHESVKEAISLALQNNETDYGPNGGMDYLRQAIANKYTAETGLTYHQNQVLITFGGTEAILMAMLAVLNPNDQVILTDPHYPNYLGQLAQVQAVPVLLPVDAEHQFQYTAEQVEQAITKDTKMLILNSPANPTGAIIPKEELLKIAALCKQHQIYLLADEVYEKIVFREDCFFSTAAITALYESGLLLLVNSFSKSYAMTGYRIGYLLASDPAIIEATIQFREGVAFAVPQFIQRAAEAALLHADDYTNEMVAIYKERSRRFISQLNTIKGFKCHMPEATFYAFVDVSAYPMSSAALADAILEKVQVALSPGSSFGQAGEHHLRISLAASDEDLNEAIRRLEIFQKEHFPDLE